MEINKKFIAKMTRIYGLIVLISNVIAVLVPQYVSIPVLNEENNLKWEAFLANNHLASVAMLFAFLVPTLVCIIYSYRIFKSDEKIVKNVAEIPSVFSLSPRTDRDSQHGAPEDSASGAPQSITGKGGPHDIESTDRGILAYHHAVPGRAGQRRRVAVRHAR